MLLTALLLAAAAPTGALVVETGSPDSFCPSLSQAAQAIHARLGTIKAEQQGWRARYTVGHAPGSDSGDFVRLELYDSQAQLRLSRDIPIRGESCATMAQSLAIVLGGYFTRVSDSARLDETSTPSEHNESQTPRRDANDTEASTRNKAPEETERQKALPSVTRQPPHSSKLATERPARVHRLGAGMYVPFSSTSRGLAISYSVTPREHQEFGVHIALPLERVNQTATAGSVDMTSYRARLWYGLALESQRFSLSMGPSLLFGIDVAQGHDLDENFKHERFVVALGLLADATVQFNTSFGVGIQGGIDLTSRSLSRRFLVQGEDPEFTEEVHAPRLFNGFVGLTLKILLHE